MKREGQNKMKKISLALITGFLISFVSAHTGDDLSAHHDMMGWSSWGFGMGLFGWTFMILVVVALVLLIVWLAKQIQEPKRKHGRK